MGVTRRRFLGSAARSAAVAMGLPLDPWRFFQSSPAVAPNPHVALLDLREDCYLRESLAGYASALTDLGAPWLRVQWPSVPRCAALIVPGALEIRPSVLRAVAACLDGGARVILESGAGFAAGPRFRVHRAMLRDHLEIELEPPVTLWPAHGGSRSAPYVDFIWPYATKVRDFSRVVPLGRQAGQIIAWADGVPVALKRRWGRGTLIVLGSPLGPALWAGDREARRWLAEVLRPVS
jgi:hypothetical protein